MAATIPMKLDGVALFTEGSNTDFAVGDITLPSLANLTDSLSGAGILGEVELPSEGHYGSLEMGIAWRTISRDAFAFISPKVTGLEVRGAFKEFDKTKGYKVTKSIKVVARGFSKGIDLGTLVVNAATDTTNTIELTYLKIFIEGDEVFELDKFNYICRINGVDVQSDVRKALGLA
ncbi:phage major tail tube protein [Paenibacillus brevis]|uniref:Phage major tail tube protein n=1 Tax=Paenibacillus brevis TaxID=2841508 RepID=A0ABS6FU22_9BACL|nr:phage major tail tube protein [Paenibacillus brevis]MBU5672645.1 phage major tail tube protein [Paenibacillus brevis]